MIPALFEPGTARLTPGSEWVVGHVAGCVHHSLDKIDGIIGPSCTCGHVGLRVYDLPDGELGLVLQGQPYREAQDGEVKIGLSEWTFADSPEDAPWREAWERLLRQDTTPLGKRYVVAKQIPDGLVVLSEVHDERYCPGCQPHRRSRVTTHCMTPMLLRVAEREMSRIVTEQIRGRPELPLGYLRLLEGYHALLFERGGTDAVAKGDLENLRVVRREELP